MSIIKKIYHDSHLRKTQIEVASDNLSREAIPGEREKFVKEPKSFQEVLKRPHGLKQTHAKHLSGTASNHAFEVGINKHNLETGLNNNSIDSEEQHATIAEAATKITRNLAMFRALTSQSKTVLDR